MKKTNKYAFANGTELMVFLAENCEKCIKYSHFNEKTQKFTKYRCAIQRDIDYQMWSDDVISERTLKVCDDFTFKGKLCEFRQTERKTTKKQKQSFCPECLYNIMGVCEYDDVCEFQ